MADKKPKKRYSLYRQGVNDSIDTVTNLLLYDIFANDPRANREEIQEKVLYIRKKLMELIK
jgi:hypothetical protein